MPYLQISTGLALLLHASVTWGAGPATGSVREQEIAQCLAGELQTWGDGRDRPAAAPVLRFVLDSQSAPAWFEEATVMLAVQKAATAWSACGVTAQVVSASSSGSEPKALGTVHIAWSEVGSAGNMGLANLGQRTLSLNPAMFALLRKVNPRHDARETLQMVVSHEMGHFFGVMAHSRRCVDVTSYYDDGKGQTCSIRGGGRLVPGVEYRATLPTACDIARCRAANGVGPAQ
ncbi:MAG: hypothetical protein V4858_06270 [Pseudomonadota bacterium]